MKLEKTCRLCEIERELANTDLTHKRKAELLDERRGMRHTCRNPRNNRTRGA